MAQTGFFAGLVDGLFPPPQRTVRENRSRQASPLAGKLLRAFGLFSALGLGVAAAVLVLSSMGGLPSHLTEPGEETLADGVPDCLAIEAGVTPRDWTAIVLHHSGTPAGCAKSFDQHHRLHNGWRSLGYHFVIGNGTGSGDGEIETGPRWSKQETGAHAHSPEYNEHGIGICLVGNFDLQPPSEAQVRALCLLVGELCRRFGIPKNRIYSHGQIREGGTTVCPGRYFPLDKIKKQIEN